MGGKKTQGCDFKKRVREVTPCFTTPAVQTCVYILFTKTDRRRTYDQKFLKTDADNTHLTTHARPLLGVKPMDGHRTLKPSENQEEVGQITGTVAVIFCFSLRSRQSSGASPSLWDPTLEKSPPGCRAAGQQRSLSMLGAAFPQNCGGFELLVLLRDPVSCFTLCLGLSRQTIKPHLRKECVVHFGLGHEEWLYF